MDRRVVFSGWLFPAALLLPQLAVTVIFFFWPAGQAIVQSVQGGDAFGLNRAVALLDEGASSPEVAEMLGVSDSWVRKMRLRRDALGHLEPGSRLARIGC